MNAHSTEHVFGALPTRARLGIPLDASAELVWDNEAGAGSYLHEIQKYILSCDRSGYCYCFDGTTRHMPASRRWCRRSRHRPRRRHSANPDDADPARPDTDESIHRSQPRHFPVGKSHDGRRNSSSVTGENRAPLRRWSRTRGSIHGFQRPVQLPDGSEYRYHTGCQLRRYWLTGAAAGRQGTTE